MQKSFQKVPGQAGNGGQSRERIQVSPPVRLRHATSTLRGITPQSSPGYRSSNRITSQLKLTPECTGGEAESVYCAAHIPFDVADLHLTTSESQTDLSRKAQRALWPSDETLLEIRQRRLRVPQ